MNITNISSHGKFFFNFWKLFKMSSTATSKRKTHFRLMTPTKTNETTLKRQLPSAEVIVAAISCRKGISSSTRDIANLSFGNPTWPWRGKVQKNFFLSAYVSSTTRANSKTSSPVPVVRAPIFEINFSDPRRRSF